MAHDTFPFTSPPLTRTLTSSGPSLRARACHKLQPSPPPQIDQLSCFMYSSPNMISHLSAENPSGVSGPQFDSGDFPQFPFLPTSTPNYGLYPSDVVQTFDPQHYQQYQQQQGESDEDFEDSEETLTSSSTHSSTVSYFTDPDISTGSDTYSSSTASTTDTPV